MNWTKGTLFKMEEDYVEYIQMMEEHFAEEKKKKWWTFVSLIQLVTVLQSILQLSLSIKSLWSDALSIRILCVVACCIRSASIMTNSKWTNIRFSYWNIYVMSLTIKLKMGDQSEAIGEPSVYFQGEANPHFAGKFDFFLEVKCERDSIFVTVNWSGEAMFLFCVEIIFRIRSVL